MAQQSPADKLLTVNTIIKSLEKRGMPYCFMDAECTFTVDVPEGVYLTIASILAAERVYILKFTDPTTLHVNQALNAIYLPHEDLMFQINSKFFQIVTRQETPQKVRLNNDGRGLCRQCGGPVTGQIWFSNQIHGICIPCEMQKKRS